MGIRQIKPKLRFEIKIKGERWIVSLLTKTQFDVYHPDTMGMTWWEEKDNVGHICLRGYSVSKNTIAHEILHAFCWHRKHQGKSYGVVEESICEEFGRNHAKMMYLIEYIFERINGRSK